jgi:hypothetical protein
MSNLNEHETGNGGYSQGLPNVRRYPSILQQEAENRLSPLREVIRDFCGKVFQF